MRTESARMGTINANAIDKERLSVSVSHCTFHSHSHVHIQCPVKNNKSASVVDSSSGKYCHLHAWRSKRERSKDSRKGKKHKTRIWVHNQGSLHMTSHAFKGGGSSVISSSGNDNVWGDTVIMHKYGANHRPYCLMTKSAFTQQWICS